MSRKPDPLDSLSALAASQVAKRAQERRELWEAIKRTQPDLAAFLTEWKALGNTIGAIRYGEPLAGSGTYISADDWLAAHKHNGTKRRRT